MPYKNGMSGFIKSQIGTGVPARDKAALYREVGKYLEGIASFCAEAKAVGGKTIPTLDSPKDYASHEEFRRWVCQCTGTHRITFELCGMRQDEKQRPILEEIEKKLWADFGENTPESVLNISVVYRNIGQWQAALEVNIPWLRSHPIRYREPPLPNGRATCI